MLKEAWQWWRSECLPSARKMGHLAEAIALDARAERQKAAWQVHLAHSRAAIIKLANSLTRRESVLVLGSGSLHDIPIEHLSGLFKHVYLADIVHLLPAKEASQYYANVTLIDVDLTSLTDAMVSLPSELNDALFTQWYTQALTPITWPAGISYVVSANCLSQLPVKPIEWLQKHCTAISEEALNAFAWQLLHQHVALLRSFHVPVCLISDDEQITRNANGDTVERTAYVQALGLSNEVFARWTWDIAPQGELPQGYTAQHNVVAIRL